jgi:DHA1 family multidrug resistance protein-like MFS transporter
MSSHNWKKNVYAVAVAEFLVIVGFNSVMPFLPLLMKEIGGVDNAGAALWAGVATGGAGLAMFVSSPLWGIAADRWGRKPMMLRAQFGGALIVLLMAFAPNIGSLVALRIVQGMLTGTIAAASALVSSQSPPDRLTFSMGILMGAIFSGSTIGPFLGGLLADSLGYRTTFIIMSGIVLISALIILFTVSEKFERASGQRIASPSGLWQLA